MGNAPEPVRVAGAQGPGEPSFPAPQYLCVSSGGSSSLGEGREETVMKAVWVPLPEQNSWPLCPPPQFSGDAGARPSGPCFYQRG